MELRKLPIYAESWNVAFRIAKEGSILDDKKTLFHVIPNSFRYWAADPFPFEYQDDIYIFAELYDYIKRRGILGYYKLTGKNARRWTPIICEPFHLSYPYIFQYANDIYIMPESNKGRSVFLYKAINFPDKWELIEVLCSNVSYADTTPIVTDSGNIALTYDVTDPYQPGLFLIDLTGHGKPVSQDLDKIDCRRPVGKVFQRNDKNIRPAQYCVGGYGKGIIFYEYRLLENEVLDENQLQLIRPQELEYNKDIYLDGMHTYNAAGGYEVIDIKTRRFNLLNLVCRIIGKLKSNGRDIWR